MAQDGVVDDSSGLRMWWEMIGPGVSGAVDSSITEIKMYSGTHRGDEVTFSTSYTPANSQTGAYAYFSFYVHNYATGEIENPSVTTAAGYPASYFYNGGTAEAIDERNAQSGMFDALRNFSRQDWVDSSDVRMNGVATNLRSEPGHQWLDMNNDDENLMLANSAIETGSTSKEFQVEFDHCGQREARK